MQQVLWNPLSLKRGKMPYLQQMVLQRPRQYFVFPRHQPPCPCSPQGGDVAFPIDPWRDNARVLQLRYEKCIHNGFHPRKVRHCCRPSMPPALRFHAINQGYELGFIEMAAAHRRPFILTLVGCGSYRCGAAKSQALVDPDDW